MVQNILQWLQGVYSQQGRTIRQGSFREYLPPANTQKPRPFETVSPPGDDGNFQNGNFINGGYPPAGSITPQPPFPIFKKSRDWRCNRRRLSFHGTYSWNPDFLCMEEIGVSPLPRTSVTNLLNEYCLEILRIIVKVRTIFIYRPGFSGYPTQKPDVSTQAPKVEFTGYPSYSTPAVTDQPPPEKTGTTTEADKPGIPTHPSETLGFSTHPPESPVFSTQPPERTTVSQPLPEISTGYPYKPDLSTELSPVTTHRSQLTSEPEGPSTHVPVTLPPASPTETFTSVTLPDDSQPTTQSPEANTIPTEKSAKPDDNTPTGSETDDDLKHPPHIHDINVECAKRHDVDQRYYNMPECRYVKENSRQAKHSFTVNLNMCGTEFINAFDTQGQSYLENVLVMQNEPGIQEIWDTVRAVRCLWEGNLKETLSVALSVGMLSQEIVTFSGDTAMAKLDVVLGKGPFGQTADGLVKIGEPMTLVVSVSGDPGFDLQVKDCNATDSTGDNVVALTDDDGCILKPKLFGAFQKTRNTGDSGASIIAYAYFNAFKFPDVIDMMIECSIELCKTDCEMCPDPNQQVEPGRRRKRDVNLNQTLHEGVTMGKHLRIILPEDLNEQTVVELGKNAGICMSTESFMFSSFLLMSLLASSCLFSAYIWLKSQRLYVSKH
ncbi:hypothetical protein NQ318_000899 [Aromia moschata]|uniref:ZP domain-containing protein n=1 Tax=Aromia moschata TaxID=1265417 RepID=A0AAV8ZDH2_9CUCU|nr:hypothetical protein NQ318_000899 [Aromia moschata]